jgi:hypothetical protein
MSALKALVFKLRSLFTSSFVTAIVSTGAVFGVFFNALLAASLLHAASPAMELARLDSSKYLQKSPGGHMTQLEPIGECRDPLASQAVVLRSVLIMAMTNDLPSMRKDRKRLEGRSSAIACDKSIVDHP